MSAEFLKAAEIGQSKARALWMAQMDRCYQMGCWDAKTPDNDEQRAAIAELGRLWRAFRECEETTYAFRCARSMGRTYCCLHRGHHGEHMPMTAAQSGGQP